MNSKALANIDFMGKDEWNVELELIVREYKWLISYVKYTKIIVFPDLY